MSGGEEIQGRKPVSEEDAARANHYALIGRLFYEAPDSILLAQLCRADMGSNAEDTPLDRAWLQLREACSAAYPTVVKQEHDTLFLGVGKAEVTPYTSHYVKGTSPDRHLVRLRERLDQLGLGRRSAAFEVEDHVSGICDVMRFVIEDGHPLSEQSLFFREFVDGGVAPFCAAVARTNSSKFYRCVAEFARAFLAVEREAFEMHESEA
jgi:TorA maturation chaperone TorD